jgi:hypothetical protein
MDMPTLPRKPLRDKSFQVNADNQVVLDQSLGRGAA